MPLESTYSNTTVTFIPFNSFLGKGGMTNENVNDDVTAPSAALDVTGSKEKSDVED